MPPGQGRYTPDNGVPIAREPKTVFISYSDEDLQYLEMLRPFLDQLESQKYIKVFNHRRIKLGANRWSETKLAISKCSAAILIVTQVYLNSPDVLSNQLPELLDEAKCRGLKIFPLKVEPCLYDVSRLSDFQPFIRRNKSTKKTLSQIARKGDKQELLVEFFETVIAEITHL